MKGKTRRKQCLPFRHNDTVLSKQGEKERDSHRDRDRDRERERERARGSEGLRKKDRPLRGR